MRTRLGWLFVISTALGSGCGGPRLVHDDVLLERRASEPPAPQVTLRDFAGRFHIEGRPQSDGCAQQIYLAAQNLEVDPAGRSLFADVVDRRYAARVEDGALIAEGRFEDHGRCPSSTLYERWVLERQPDGTLVGTLASTWALPPICNHPCTVRFAIEASPIGAP